MKQLSPLDNMFISLEHGNQVMHVASLGIYDPSTAPGGKVRFKQILAHYASRLDMSKIFQRRLVTVPLGIDLPFWVDDGAIDLEYHVRHIALPHPGDWRQLMIQVARLHSRPLDMKRPLWETYVIEGLDNIEGLPKGCFALYAKMHHSIVDGETGAEIMRLHHDLSPIGRQVDRLKTYVADSQPSTLELLIRGVAGRASRISTMTRTLFSLSNTGVRLGKNLVGQAVAEPEHITQRLKALFSASNPHTRFSERVSPHRVVTGLALPLEGFQAIRAQLPGVTINDVFLSISGGAVRTYLQAKNELPAETMHAAVPVSTRGEQKSADAGNMVTGTKTSMHTEIADPVERLLAVHDSMEKSKRAMEALGQDLMRQISHLLPLAPAQMLQKYVVAPMASVTVSNIKGPTVPLYFAGARLVRFMPISIATDGIGLNITGFSYDGQMWICAVSCRKMMPDPEAFVAAMHDAFNELKAAVLPAQAQAKKTVTGGDKMPAQASARSKKSRT